MNKAHEWAALFKGSTEFVKCAWVFLGASLLLVRMIHGRLTPSATGTGKDNQSLRDEGLAQPSWQMNCTEKTWNLLSLRDFRIGGGGFIASMPQAQRRRRDCNSLKQPFHFHSQILSLPSFFTGTGWLFYWGLSRSPRDCSQGTESVATGPSMQLRGMETVADASLDPPTFVYFLTLAICADLATAL